MFAWLDRTRYIAVILVVAIVIGAFVLIGIGCYYTWEAITKLVGLSTGDSAVSWTIGAKLAILKAVDSFLFATVLLYLGFGMFFLGFGSDSRNGDLPNWLEIRSVAQMKKTLLEVIVVLLAILFLQALVEQAGDLDWLLLIYPAAIVALAIALKLIPFEH